MQAETTANQGGILPDGARVDAKRKIAVEITREQRDFIFNEVHSYTEIGSLSGDTGLDGRWQRGLVEAAWRFFDQVGWDDEEIPNPIVIEPFEGVGMMLREVLDYYGGAVSDDRGRLEEERGWTDEWLSFQTDGRETSVAAYIASEEASLAEQEANLQMVRDLLVELDETVDRPPAEAMLRESRYREWLDGLDRQRVADDEKRAATLLAEGMICSPEGEWYDPKTHKEVPSHRTPRSSWRPPR